ncbi:MAG: hypothetical protein ACOXZ4_02700 [Sphaerochaetaceae bacterium]
MKTERANDGLIPLDNSAIIYPPTVARYNTHMFRLSVDVEIEVVEQRLLTALEHVIERFPYFAVSLHSGFFWYYFTANKKPLAVWPEVSHPCGFLHRKRGAHGYLFKVFHAPRRIAVEFFHALSDGTGALIFLKTLVAEYLRLSGHPVGPDPQIFDLGESAKEAEWEDSFEKRYVPLKSIFGFESHAFHLKNTSALTDEVQAISGRIAIEELKRISSLHQVTITEYLVAELLDALQRVQTQEVKNPKRYKPVRISVPVNIRKVFDSVSMRNFTLFVVVGIDPRLGHYEFGEILTQVVHQLRGSVNAKSLSRQLSRNVAGRRNPLIRYAPFFLKKPFMKLLSDSYGDAIFSSTLSNLGSVTLPAEMAKLIRRMDFYLSPSKANKVSCAAIGVNGFVNVNFTSIYERKVDFEREFFTALVNKGIGVEVSTNRGSSWPIASVAE